jgi:hypothetical protein
MKRLIVAVSAWSLSIAPLAATQEKAPSLPEQKTVKVLGARLRYYELGSPSAPTVMILHGLGDRGRTSPARRWVGGSPRTSPSDTHRSSTRSSWSTRRA